jgi:hypothetical protein
LAASRRNAILIVPQGPLDASDSFGGKLEDADGFKRFMAEALEVLRQQGLVGKAGVGRIILSGHSGGYEVISAILARGGLTGRIGEVWLFDALYAKTERFALWFDHHAGRFIDLYTEHGGTKDESEALMTALRGNGVPYFSADETNATAADLRNNHLLFLFSALPHDHVVQERETFRRFLETSFLAPTGTKSVRSVNVRDAPEARALAERARQIGDDLYPQILGLLGDGKSEPPRQFDIVIRQHLGPPGLDGESDALWGLACRETVFLNAGWLCDHPEALDHVMIHEMAHVAQNYPHFAYRHVWQWCAHYLAFTAAHPFRSYPPAEPTYWTHRRLRLRQTGRPHQRLQLSAMRRAFPALQDRLRVRGLFPSLPRGGPRLQHDLPTQCRPAARHLLGSILYRCHWKTAGRIMGGFSKDARLHPHRRGIQ